MSLEPGALLNSPGTDSWWVIEAIGRHSETGREIAILATEDGRLAWALDVDVLKNFRPPGRMPEIDVAADRIRSGQQWRHCKGGRYESRGVVQDARSGEDLVVYFQEGSSIVWLRPLKMWFEPVAEGARFVAIEPEAAASAPGIG